MAENLQFRLIGRFRVLASDGKDLTPRASKACALLAILSLSHNHARSRAQLQDKLWSDRQPAQGAQSLRQALSDIRRSFGPYLGILQSERGMLALDPARIDLDIAQPLESLLNDHGLGEAPTLLDNLDSIYDPEFQDWLREQRAAFAERMRRDRSIRPEPSNNATSDIGKANTPSQSPVPVTVAINATSSNETHILLARDIADTIVRNIEEQNAVEVRNTLPASPGIAVNVALERFETNFLVATRLIEVERDVVLWSSTQTISPDDIPLTFSEKVRILVNRAVEVAISKFADLHSDSDMLDEFISNVRATQSIFQLREEALEKADEILSQAIECHPRGLYFAKRAYIRACLVSEASRPRDETVCEEAEAFAAAALEREPFNSSVLALVSHVYSLLLRRHFAAHDIAKQAVEYNAANPLAYAYLGRAKAYLGDSNAAYNLTKYACKIAGPAPYVHMIQVLSATTATLTGRYDEAIHLFETAEATRPGFRPPLRSLAPLYLATNRRENARRVIERMRRYEPDFSLERLKDSSYPNKSLKDANLLRFSDADI